MHCRKRIFSSVSCSTNNDFLRSTQVCKMFWAKFKCFNCLCSCALPAEEYSLATTTSWPRCRIYRQPRGYKTKTSITTRRIQRFVRFSSFPLTHSRLRELLSLKRILFYSLLIANQNNFSFVWNCNSDFNKVASLKDMLRQFRTIR